MPPEAGKAVRWNSPFYGIEDKGWFISFHCFTKYIKVTFLNGAHLDPRVQPRAARRSGTVGATAACRRQDGRLCDLDPDLPGDAQGASTARPVDTI